MKHVAWIAAVVALVAVALVARTRWSADAGAERDMRQLGAAGAPDAERGGASGAGGTRPGGMSQRAPGGAPNAAAPGRALSPDARRAAGGMRVAPGDLPARRLAGAAGQAEVGGPEAKAAAERAHDLPDARQHREQVLEQIAPEPPPGADPDLVLSVPLKGAIDTEAGAPPVHAEGMTVGQDGTVQFGDGAMMKFEADASLGDDAGSIAFSIVPDWAGSDPTNQSFVQVLSADDVRENRISLVKNLDSLRFILITDTGIEHNVGLEIGDWGPGEPHRVTATWGESQMSLYVDGRLVNQLTYDGRVKVAPGGPIYLGYNQPNSAYVGPGGAISDFKIFGRTLDAGEVGF